MNNGPDYFNGTLYRVMHSQRDVDQERPYIVIRIGEGRVKEQGYASLEEANWRASKLEEEEAKG